MRTGRETGERVRGKKRFRGVPERWREEVPAAPPAVDYNERRERETEKCAANVVGNCSPPPASFLGPLLPTRLVLQMLIRRLPRVLSW